MFSYEKFYDHFVVTENNKPIIHVDTESEAKKIIFELKSENIKTPKEHFVNVGKNYTVYHLHTMYSLLDSSTHFEDYVDRAKELGMKAIGCSEHGNTYGWLKKKMYAEKNGLKFLFGIECYLTETHEEKIRDNYHTILIAKNFQGMEEINKLFFNSTDREHTYYKPRLSFEEFLNISNNVIKISACVQSPLDKYRLKIKDDFTEQQKEMLIKLLKHYDYYEIQYHNTDWQIEYNQYLYKMSKRFNKPLIVGTDTHSIDNYRAECRTVLQWGKTSGAWGDDENECDLTFKSYDELVEMFKIQDSLPMDVILEAIENTNVMADSVEQIDFDTDSKYPLLYGDKDEEVLWQTLRRKYKEKVNRGEIDGNDQRYIDAIKEEMAVFKKINMIGFMLFMSEIVSWAKDNHIAVGFARGSCSGSTVAYITDITDVDPIKWNTVFSRFANVNRIEEGDIDLDFYEDDRPKIYDYIINRFGTEKTAYILALGTLADKAVIDVIGKALSKQYRIKHNISLTDNNNPNDPYRLDVIAQIKKEYDQDKETTKEKYKDIFYYYDGLVGCIVSQSQHPAGILVSPINLIETVGAFHGADGQVIVPLDMEECHELGLVKFDILGLKSIGVIDKAFKLVGKSFPKAYQIDWNDQKVFEDISNDSTSIFQFESSFAHDSIKKMQPRSIDDLSLCSACLRPSGESYRNAVFNHEVHKNPSELIDNVLSNSYGYLVYQEQTIAFLQQACGLSGSASDTMRRNIAKKQEDKVNAMLPKVIEGYCDNSDKPKNIAEEEVKDFIQVIQDASGYQFGFNHSESYSMLSYVMGWLRYYYPTEYCTSYLNCAKNDDDLINGTALAKNKGCKIVNPKFRMSTSEYGCDGSIKTIYKGIGSIKDMQSVVGDELYELSQKKKYSNFLSLLFDIKTKTSCNKTSLDILIKLDYFSEFGDINYLLKVVEIYNKYIGKNDFGKRDRKQFRKNDLEKFYPIEREAIEKFTTDVSKNGNTVYVSRQNIYKLVKYLCDNLKRDTTDIYDKVVYEAKFLGYTSITVPNSPYCVVESIDEDSYGRRFAHINRLSDGFKGVFRCSKVWYNEYGLEQGQLIKAIFDKKPKKIQNEKGKWVNSKTDFYWELSAWS